MTGPHSCIAVARQCAHLRLRRRDGGPVGDHRRLRRLHLHEVADALGIERLRALEGRLRGGEPRLRGVELRDGGDVVGVERGQRRRGRARCRRRAPDPGRPTARGAIVCRPIAFCASASSVMIGSPRSGSVTRSGGLIGASRSASTAASSRPSTNPQTTSAAKPPHSAMAAAEPSRLRPKGRSAGPRTSTLPLLSRGRSPPPLTTLIVGGRRLSRRPLAAAN